MTLNPDEDNLILEGSLAINGTGNSRNNLIVGNSANNILDGKAGKDILKGKAGDDIYIVDNKKDKAIERAQQGNDTIQSSVSKKPEPTSRIFYSQKAKHSRGLEMTKTRFWKAIPATINSKARLAMTP